MSSHPEGIGGSWLLGRGGGSRSSGWRGEPEVHGRACVGYSGAPWGSVFGSCFPRHTAITARAWHKCRPKLRDCPESLATAVGPQRWAEGVCKGKPSCSCWTQAGVAVTVLPHGPLPRLAPGVTHTAPVAATRERFEWQEFQLFVPPAALGRAVKRLSFYLCRPLKLLFVFLLFKLVLWQSRNEPPGAVNNTNFCVSISGFVLARRQQRVRHWERKHLSPEAQSFCCHFLQMPV